jgi:hypothetical protein
MEAKNEVKRKIWKQKEVKRKIPERKKNLGNEKN